MSVTNLRAERGGAQDVSGEAGIGNDRVGVANSALHEPSPDTLAVKQT